MNILFVCRGNVCRSAYAEYVLRAELRRLDAAGVTVSSRGLLSLDDAPMDPRYARRLAGMGIDASGHRSRPLDGTAVWDADLILVFTRQQLDDVIDRDLAAYGKTYLLDDLANLCAACADAAGADDVPTPGERLQAVIAMEPFTRPTLPRPHDIEDPYRREDTVYDAVAAGIDRRVRTLASTLAGGEQS